MITCGLAALAAPATAAGTTVYVSTAGADDTGCGTSTANQCATIQYGVDQAAAGDTVQVSAGTYNETVTVTKPLSLIGAGAGTTAIDGLGQPSTNYATVNILNPGGDVTFSGFTVTNPVTSQNGQPFDVTVYDSSAADTITVSNNAFLGDPVSAADSANGPLGLNTANVAADQVIQDNDFSGLWQGILLEGSSGPIDVSGNTFHDLIATGDGNGGSYPAEGVYVLSDSGVNAAGQNISDNTFSNYGGVGIKYSAGYDLGGCTARVCDGTVTGSITDNTFALTAPAADSTLPAAAMVLKAVNSGDALNLTVGGNTGTVAAPTTPILEQPNDGTVAITPGTTPNTVTTVPAPTISVSPPSSITTDEPAVSLPGSTSNPSGEDLAHSRYDVTITGTSGIQAGQLDLEYNAGTGYLPVTLTGTASSGSAITGHLGAPAGFTLVKGAAAAIRLRVAVPDVSAPAGQLTATLSLDQVSSGTGNPVIDTLASSTSTTTIVDNSPPVATGRTVVTQIGTPVAITLPANDADHDALTYTHTTPAHGTLSGSGASVTFTPAAGFVGSTSFAYTVSDGKAGADTSTVTIVVGKATSTIGVSVAPSRVTTGSRPVLTVSVSTKPTFGTADGGTVTVTGATGNRSTFGFSGVVRGGKVTFALPRLAAGTTRLTIGFGGTATATRATRAVSFSVAKVTPLFSYVTSPSTVKASTSSRSKVVVTVVSAGADASGATVRLQFGTKIVSTGTVSGGKVTLALPALSAGKHSLHVLYAGNAATKASTKLVVVQVAKG